LTAFADDQAGNRIAATDTAGAAICTYCDALGRLLTLVRNLTGQTIQNPTQPERGSVDQNLRNDTFYFGTGSADYVMDGLGLTIDYASGACGCARRGPGLAEVRRRRAGS